MIYGKLNDRTSHAFLLGNPVWKKAFDWVKSMDVNMAEGSYPILGESMIANVMSYETVKPEESRFETHRKYIDLQYTIRGGEIIRWASAKTLTFDGGYEADRDLQFYDYAESDSQVYNGEGCFSIYYPEDAHLPKIHDGQNDSIFKVVIKIAVDLEAKGVL